MRIRLANRFAMRGMASVKAAEVSASVPPRRGQPKARRKASAKAFGGTSPAARPADIDISQLEFIGAKAMLVGGHNI